MRKQIIAGNWKMNTTYKEGLELLHTLKSNLETITETEIVICPPFTHLDAAKNIVNNTKIKIGAQNCYEEESGAYTGEISCKMLQSIHCDYVIIGHSERRTYLRETNAQFNKKIKLAYAHNLIPIYCIGETLSERETNQTYTVLETQLREGLSEIALETNPIVIAYEPVWAIGTGKVATPDQAQDAHQFIRNTLKTLYSEAIAQTIQIQYGGSVKPENSTTLLNLPDIDGALIGGASLDPLAFTTIIKEALTLQRS